MSDDNNNAVDSQAKLDFALDLMRRLPPQSIESNLSALIDLTPDLSEDLLSAIDQPLKVSRDKRIGRDYLLCDYNRDGDSYRSPWSSVYEPPFDDGIQPSPRLRQLEIEANAAFDQYRELYYEGGCSSVYLWDTDYGFSGVVLLKKSNSGGEWDGIHVVEVTEKKSQMKAHYKLTSTVMLSLKTKKKEFGVADLGGSLMRQKQIEASISNHDSSHIANIGRMVEDMENVIRESLLSIYFDKTKNILNSLRPSVDAEEEAKRNAFANELKSKMLNRNSSSS